MNFLHNVLWAGAAVVFDGLLCIFLVRMSDALGTSLWPLHSAPTQWPPWGGCNPQQIDDLQATGHIQNGREQIYLHLSTAISAVNNLV